MGNSSINGSCSMSSMAMLNNQRVKWEKHEAGKRVERSEHFVVSANQRMEGRAD